MKLTEQIQLQKTPELSKFCHLAKNLYNTANFHYRQFLFHLDEFITYYDLQLILKKREVYKSLPAQTSQQILRLVLKNWKSYWRSLREYKKKPNKFLGRPKFPKYEKKNGESIAIFTNQNTRIKNGNVRFPKSTHLPPLKTRIAHYQQIRIIPKGNYYIAEIIYNKKEIDLGVNNLLASANNIGLAPLIVKGKVIKSINTTIKSVLKPDQKSIHIILRPNGCTSLLENEITKSTIFSIKHPEKPSNTAFNIILV